MILITGDLHHLFLQTIHPVSIVTVYKQLVKLTLPVYQTFSTKRIKRKYSQVVNPTSMKISFILTILIVITPVMMGQEVFGTQDIRKTSESDTLEQKISPAGSAQVLVNMEMIRRFQEVKTEGDIYSWSQLIVNHDSRAIQEYMLAYRTSDLNGQSMAGIQLALEKKIKEMTPLQPDQEDEYYAGIKRIKQEISFKLRSENPVAMK
jgi:hypothetical protein